MSLIVTWLNRSPPTMTLGSREAQKWAEWGLGASAVHFGENFINQKLLGTPNLVGVGHLRGSQIQIWTDLGPV